MDRITEMLSQLQELTNEQLSELEESILTEFAATESQELSSTSVSQMSQLADAVEAVRNEQSRRVAEAEALQSEAAAAAARVKGEAAVADEDTEEEVVPAAPVEPETPADEVEVEVESPEEEEEKDKKPVFANEAEETASVETPSESEAAVEEAPVATAEQPEEASASADTPAEAEAAVETPTEAEASVETPAEAEAAVEEEAVAEAAVETPVEAEAAVEEAASEAEAQPEAELSTDNEENNTEATVTAAAQGGNEGLDIQVPSGHEPIVKPATTLTITAGADVPGVTAGTPLKDTLEVAEAFQKRLHSLRHVHGGDGEQHIVASFHQEFPEDRFLTTSDSLENTHRIQSVTSQEAIVAAAGICLPLETRYDLGCDVGVTDRPVRDSLARFGADRGGIRFFSAPTLAQESPAFADATGFWRGDGSDPNSGTWHTYGPDRTTQTSPADQKPCLEMNCVAENTAYIEAITLCLTFNNLTARTFPELIKRQNELALVAHARVAENALLAQIEAGSTAVTAQAQVVGATREILNLFERASAAYRFKHRIGNTPLRAIIPSWVRNLLRADLVLQMPGDGLELFDIAESRIDAWFRSRGINVTWHIDGVGPAAVDADGAGSGVALEFVFPDAIEFALFAEGTWLFLDGGTLDLGVIRDSSLVATNQYKQFVESFEGVANIGCDSFWVTANYEPCGSAADLVETCGA